MSAIASITLSGKSVSAVAAFARLTFLSQAIATESWADRERSGVRVATIARVCFGSCSVDRARRCATLRGIEHNNLQRSGLRNVGGGDRSNQLMAVHEARRQNAVNVHHRGTEKVITVDGQYEIAASSGCAAG